MSHSYLASCSSLCQWKLRRAAQAAQMRTNPFPDLTPVCELFVDSAEVFSFSAHPQVRRSDVLASHKQARWHNKILERCTRFVCFCSCGEKHLWIFSPFPLPNIIHGKHEYVKAVNGEQRVNFFPYVFNLLLKKTKKKRPHNIMQPVWFGLSASLYDILADSVPVLLCQLHRSVSLICQADAVRLGFILNCFAITWENELTTSLFFGDNTDLFLFI